MVVTGIMLGITIFMGASLSVFGFSFGTALLMPDCGPPCWPCPGSSTPERSVPPTVTATTFAEFAQLADYLLPDSLHADPQAGGDGHDHQPRQVFSGPYL
jgi:hypothetical protein